MNTTMTPIRQTIELYLNQLSSQRLQLVAEMLAYLSEREEDEATEELLDIPGFIESFERGCRDLVKGRITPYEQLKRKY